MSDHDYLETEKEVWVGIRPRAEATTSTATGHNSLPPASDRRRRDVQIGEVRKSETDRTQLIEEGRAGNARQSKQQ